MPALDRSPVSYSAPSSSGLFIVGHARSGTTILQNALNDSHEIFLFGEAQFYLDRGSADFAARYNAMHRSFGNQITKSTYCPLLLAEDGTWQDYLNRLGMHYRYVGDKVALGTEADGYSCERFFTFQCRHFFDARYIFTFRNPVDCIASSAALLGKRDVYVWMESYLNVVLLCIRMLRLFPHVTAVFLEDRPEKTFDELRVYLGSDLSGAHLYYDRTRVTRYPADALPADARSMTDSLEEVYAEWRKLPEENRLPQMEQKEGCQQNGTPSYLGRLHNTIVAMMRRFAPTPADRGLQPAGVGDQA
jgi:hypothetical protein